MDLFAVAVVGTAVVVTAVVVAVALGFASLVALVAAAVAFCCVSTGCFKYVLRLCK